MGRCSEDGDASGANRLGRRCNAPATRKPTNLVVPLCWSEPWPKGFIISSLLLLTSTSSPSSNSTQVFYVSIAGQIFAELWSRIAVQLKLSYQHSSAGQLPSSLRAFRFQITFHPTFPSNNNRTQRHQSINQVSIKVSNEYFLPFLWSLAAIESGTGTSSRHT